MARLPWVVQAVAVVGLLAGCGVATVPPPSSCTARLGEWAPLPPGGPAGRGRGRALWADREALFFDVEPGRPLDAAFFDPCRAAWDPVSSLGALSSATPPRWVAGALMQWSVAVQPEGRVYDRAARRWVPSSLPIEAMLAPTVGEHVVLFASDERFSEGRIVDAHGATVATIGRRSAPSDRVMESTVTLRGPHQLFVFGGRPRASATPYGDGALLDVRTGRWTPLPREGAPSPRFAAVVAHNGREVVVWGGRAEARMADGARFELAGRRWLPISLEGAPVWDEQVVAALVNRFWVVLHGTEVSLYDLEADEWSHAEAPFTGRALDAYPLSDGMVLIIEGSGHAAWRLAPEERRFTTVPVPAGAAPSMWVGGGFLFGWGGLCAPPCAEPARGRHDGGFLRLNTVVP